MADECQGCLNGVVIVTQDLVQKMLDPNFERTIECRLFPPVFKMDNNAFVLVRPTMKPDGWCAQFNDTP